MILSKEFITALLQEQLKAEVVKEHSTRNKNIPIEKSYDAKVFATIEEARQWLYEE